MKMKYTLFTAIMLLQLLLSGCESSADTDIRNKITKSGTKWIEDKYGFDFTVDYSSYVESGYGLFGPSYSDDIIVHFTDGTDLLYLSEEKEFSDTYEASEIVADIESTLWPSVMEDTGEYHYYSYDSNTDTYYKSPGFNYKSNNLEESFFTERYDGDILAYAKKEDLIVDGSIILICTDEEWESKFSILKDKVNALFTGQTSGELFVAALESDCYQKISDGTWYYPDIDLDGCLATMRLTQDYDILVQHYIQPLPGIYITSDEYNVILQEGDITFEQVYDNLWIAEHTEKIYRKSIEQSTEVNKTKTANDSNPVSGSGDIDHYLIDAKSPVYKMVLSDRLLKLIDPDDFSLYIKFVPGEAAMITESETPENIRFYYYPGNSSPASDCSYSIYSDYASASWYSYNSEDLFWWGTQTFEKPDSLSTQ
ncbi:MAG: hypothetical protein PHC41_11260 [Lachnospiraceae bacterium]|nr:hypothetical protein [Lachnospiraceae bacterium]MDD3616785.1 hypothetical protein [Lachnospiraceae bacterium]